MPTPGNRTLELQAIAALAVYSDGQHRLWEQYPELPELLLDSESRAFYDAVVEIGTDNAVALSVKMQGAGVARATPEYVRDKLLFLGREFEVDIPLSIRLLRETKRDVEAERLLEATLRDVKLRKITRTDARDRIATGLDGLDETRDEDFVDSSNWAAKAVSAFAHNGEMLSSGTGPTWPRPFPRLRKHIPYVRTGHMMTVTALSGAGKTLFCLQLAHQWADQGRRVLYCLTEMNWIVAVARYVNRLTGLPIDEIETGQHNIVVADLLRPFGNGGELIFWNAAGASMPTIKAEARKRGNTDIIIDTFHKVSLDNYRYNSKTDQIVAANAELADYLQHSDAIGLEVLQLDKANTATGKPSTEQAKDSIDFYQSSRLSITLDFPRAMSARTISHPIPGREAVHEYTDKPGVYGDLVIDKNSFGGHVGWRDRIFRDGSRSQIFEDVRV